MIPPTSQNPPEFAELLELYKFRKPKNVLEIGTHEGGTLYYWAKYAQPDTKIGSIDVQRINSEHYNSWKTYHDTEIIYRTAPSQDYESWKWAAQNFVALDWLFIDGGHSYDEVSKDFYLYSRLMSDNSIIAFHDILSYYPFNSEVSIFWDEIKNKYNFSEIIYPHHEWERGPGIGVIFLDSTERIF